LAQRFFKFLIFKLNVSLSDQFFSLNVPIPLIVVKFEILFFQELIEEVLAELVVWLLIKFDGLNILNVLLETLWHTGKPEQSCLIDVAFFTLQMSILSTF
jgi:hypothetical protein